jgi:hypothetical protein
MPGVPGFKSVLGSGKQTSADLTAALVARAKWSRFERATFRHAHGEELDPSAANIGPDFASLGPYDLRLEATLLGHTEGVIEQALLSCMGAVATAQVGASAAYDHEYSFAEVVPATGGYVSVERGFGRSTEAEAANFAINRVAARGGAAMLRFELQGVGGKPEKVTKGAPTLTTAPSLPGNFGTTVTIGGASTRVRGWSWNVDHANEQDGYDATTRFRKNAEYQEAMAEFESELIFEDMAMLRRFWNAAAADNPEDVGEGALYAVVLKTTGKEIASGNKHEAEWKADKVFLQSVDVEVAGRGLLRQRIRGRALRDGSTGVAKVRLRNTSTTI